LVIHLRGVLKKLAGIVGSAVAIAVILILLVLPGKARGDGGPVVGPALWRFLTEGQQVAVVELRNADTADVTLFISLLDSTGESHEVTFFVPLGSSASNFSVYEQDLFTFDQANTRDLDNILYQEVQRKQQAVASLFAATLLTNGIWLLPLWLPSILSGCAAGEPIATFETDSSQVSIYGLDENTDLDALITTTGLDPAVKETLRRLQGQRIAVVDLQTTPQGTGGGPSGGGPSAETGIRLRWTTSLDESGGTYSYPLGTGSAWYHPIEVTRVYVAAPPGLDFDIQYPRLGADRSGYEGRNQRITDYTKVPAYAVDEARGDFGHVWRAIYTQSNAAEDINITAKPESSLARFSTGLRSAGNAGWALLLGFIVALACWVLSWQYLMPRLLRGTYRGKPGGLWRHALVYTGINILLMFPGAVLYFIWNFTGNALTLAVLFLLFGGVAVIVFAASDVERLSENRSLAWRAFVLVTLVSNGAYLVFAMAYAALTGII
jgi:hypothetical protein